MKQIVTTGIVLGRTDFGEADRIVTVLTPDQGKLRLMARGVRKIKSRLAGGIELFSVSDVTFVAGRGEIGTLISSRLRHHYGRIVTDIDRVQLGYELIKLLNKATEDQPEPAYFTLLEQAFEALDDPAIDRDLIHLWFQAQLLRLSGHTPNLKTDAASQPLSASRAYTFDFESMTFEARPDGSFNAGTIKFLRLVFSGHQPRVLARIQGSDDLLGSCSPLVQTMLQNHLRL